MPHQQKSPEGQVADAIKNSWVDQFAPISTRPYLRLSRLDRPIGTWLLYIPCVWGILLAALHDSNLRLWDLWLILACGLGALLMRGAGCTWNDITDRNYDALVSRTKSRPIPSGQISVKNALFWMLIQAFCALGLLITFGSTAVIFGIASTCLVVVYPFAKRFTWWPQIFLGLTFNWGAIIGWTSVTNSLSLYCIVLYLGCVFWTVGYDTIYAHQDKIDDEFLGLKSSAIFLGKKSKPAISIFYSIFFISISFLIISLDPINKWLSYTLLAIVGFQLIRQIYLLDIDNPEICQSIFKSNNSIGFLVFFLFFLLF